MNPLIEKTACSGITKSFKQIYNANGETRPLLEQGIESSTRVHVVKSLCVSHKQYNHHLH